MEVRSLGSLGARVVDGCEPRDVNLLEEGCNHQAVFPALEECAWGVCMCVPLSEVVRESWLPWS